jgi:hypothetical protein
MRDATPHSQDHLMIIVSEQVASVGVTRCTWTRGPRPSAQSRAARWAAEPYVTGQEGPPTELVCLSHDEPARGQAGRRLQEVAAYSTVIRSSFEMPDHSRYSRVTGGWRRRTSDSGQAGRGWDEPSTAVLQRRRRRGGGDRRWAGRTPGARGEGFSWVSSSGRSQVPFVVAIRSIERGSRQRP